MSTVLLSILLMLLGLAGCYRETSPYGCDGVGERRVVAESGTAMINDSTLFSYRVVCGDTVYSGYSRSSPENQQVMAKADSLVGAAK